MYAANLPGMKESLLSWVDVNRPMSIHVKAGSPSNERLSAVGREQY
jgi:hypothetical protein